MRRKTVRWRSIRKKKATRKTRRSGGMRPAVRYASSGVKTVLGEVIKSNVQDEFGNKGPLHKYQNRINIANSSPKSYDNSSFDKENIKQHINLNKPKLNLRSRASRRHRRPLKH